MGSQNSRATLLRARAFGLCWKRGGIHKNTSASLLRARARIGVEIIYLSSVFVGHGGNRAYLRCKRVLLIW